MHFYFLFFYGSFFFVFRKCVRLWMHCHTWGSLNVMYEVCVPWQREEHISKTNLLLGNICSLGQRELAITKAPSSSAFHCTHQKDGHSLSPYILKNADVVNLFHSFPVSIDNLLTDNFHLPWDHKGFLPHGEKFKARATQTPCLLLFLWYQQILLW